MFVAALLGACGDEKTPNGTASMTPDAGNEQSGDSGMPAKSPEDTCGAGEPRLVLEGVQTSRLHLDGDDIYFVYWHDSEDIPAAQRGAIGVVSTQGGAPSTFYAPPSGSYVVSMRIDGDDVYALRGADADHPLDPGSYYVERMPKAGGAPERISTHVFDSRRTEIFAVDEGAVYLKVFEGAETHHNEVWRVNKQDGTATLLVHHEVFNDEQLYDGEIWYVHNWPSESGLGYDMAVRHIAANATGPEADMLFAEGECHPSLSVTSERIYCSNDTSFDDSKELVSRGLRLDEIGSVTTPVGETVFSYGGFSEYVHAVDVKTDARTVLACGRDFIHNLVGDETQVVWLEARGALDADSNIYWAAR